MENENELLINDDIKLQNLVLIHKTRNEVYQGILINKNNEEKECVIKYHNDESIEVEILKFLEDKMSEIPIIYYEKQGEIRSPSNKIFKSMIITNFIKGKILGPIDTKRNFNEKSLNLDDINDQEIKKNLIVTIINIFSKLHSFGVIYADDLCTNIIINDNWQVFLIDFGNSFFKTNIPPIMKLCIKQHPPECCDIFNLYNLLEMAYKITFPVVYKNTRIQGDFWENDKTSDLLKLLENL